MSYAYFPGCSAQGTGRSYEESMLAVFGALDVGVEQIQDWNCCGASAYQAMDSAQALALAARNLALAEDARPGDDPIDVVAACAGCYRNLIKTERALLEGSADAERVHRALLSVGLKSEQRARTRHPLEVLVNDVGLDRIAGAVVRPLEGVRVVCYYGCLLVRPDSSFDDSRAPTSMERLMQATGAQALDWPLRTRCCGGSCYCGGPLIGGLPDATLKLSHQLLQDARNRGADVIVTVCPLCQFNLEAFQGQMARTFCEPVDITVGFFTQLLGLALGLDERTLGLHRMLRWRLPAAAGK
jgi:heterodisulfide reductase subunit B